MEQPLAAVLFRGDEPLVHRLLAEHPPRAQLKAWSKDGSVRHVELSLGAVRSTEGRVTHWVITFSDRSEVERLRAELDSLRQLDAAA
jgi:PAS domain S-box-containing protein